MDACPKDPNNDEDNDNICVESHQRSVCVIVLVIEEMMMMMMIEVYLNSWFFIVIGIRICMIVFELCG